jgi:hypothetical protein
VTLRIVLGILFIVHHPSFGNFSSLQKDDHGRLFRVHVESRLDVHSALIPARAFRPLIAHTPSGGQIFPKVSTAISNRASILIDFGDQQEAVKGTISETVFELCKQMGAAHRTV